MKNIKRVVFRGNRQKTRPTEKVSQVSQVSEVNSGRRPGLSLALLKAKPFALSTPHSRSGLLLGAKRGLTLVELQIAIAIMAGVLFVVIAAYFAFTKMFNEEKVNIQIASENRIAIDEITNQIREANAVVTACTICGGQTTSGTNVLILSLWPLDVNGNLVDAQGTNYDYIVYRQQASPNDKNLIKEIFPGAGSYRIATSKIFSTTAKTISFAYNNASPGLATEVTVALTNETNSFVRLHTISQSSKAVLRNK